MNTPYTARLWEDAAAFHTRRRQLMQAYVFVHLHHRTPELEAALRTVGQQLAFLDSLVVQKALADMLDRMRKAADQLLETAVPATWDICS